MSIATIILGLIAVFCVVAALTLKSGYIVWDRGKVGLPRSLNEAEVRVSDLPALAEAMSRGTASVRFAALLFGTPDRPSEDDTVNIQMSVENGKLGFDWVLLAPRNVEDRERFITFARAYGVHPVAYSMNGVSYLRVEDTDIPRFTSSVVTEMYHLPPDQPVGLVYEGFEWPDS